MMTSKIPPKSAVVGSLSDFISTHVTSITSLMIIFCLLLCCTVSWLPSVGENTLTNRIYVPVNLCPSPKMLTVILEPFQIKITDQALHLKNNK